MHYGLLSPAETIVSNLCCGCKKNYDKPLKISIEATLILGYPEKIEKIWTGILNASNVLPEYRTIRVSFVFVSAERLNVINFVVMQKSLAKFSLRSSTLMEL